MSSLSAFDPSLFELFCVEIETQIKALNEGLIGIERKANDPKLLDSLMRAAHSIKGAARVVNLDSIVRLAHAMEDVFVAAQHQQIQMTEETVDQLLKGVDLLASVSKLHVNEILSWLNEQLPSIESFIQTFFAMRFKMPLTPKEVAHEEEFINRNETPSFSPISERRRMLRISTENLNRLMGLAGEVLVESHSLNPLSGKWREIKKKWSKIESLFELLRNHLDKKDLNKMAHHCLEDLRQQMRDFHAQSDQRFVEIDDFIWRHTHLSDRLYDEVVRSRMRPFADGVEAFPRLVRDLARQLGKQVRLEIEGKFTLIDREILEKLESPLNHLIRNAIDHGIEMPNDRLAAGKPMEGVIKLKAHHVGGMLAITVADDGKGIDLENLRERIVEKQLVSKEMASHLTKSEVIDFLFLPGFSTSTHVTEISGRGMGLNIVQNFVQEVGGFIRTESIIGEGTHFYFQLPLTLSVIHALLVEIAGEAYAFPLARIDRAILLSSESIQRAENQSFFHDEGKKIVLIPAWEVLDLPQLHLMRDTFSVIILSEHLRNYGVIVDRFIGEKELVLQELDPRLGKIPDISAGALMEDGSPVLVIDVEDLIHSIEKRFSGERLLEAFSLQREGGSKASAKKRILVVDDSLTVREMECRLLRGQGYEVDTAVNGVDGWNAIRINLYDLIITDIDMPRMNGIELLKMIKSDAHLQHLPVLIVSYKEGEEEKASGLAAGACGYLIKNRLQDDSLIAAVRELIGEAWGSS